MDSKPEYSLWIREEGQHHEIKYTIENYFLSFAVVHHYTENSEDQTQEFMKGHLKWDGCLDVELATMGLALHFCGPEKDPIIGRIVKLVYSLGTQIPNWDSSLER